ncbi:MAG: complex I subunit 1 family protein [Candidatus Bathyarchaeia archaeon]
MSFFLGVIYNYEIRKVSARLQSRRGPWLIVPKPLRSSFGMTRLLQPLYDILKLLYKESLMPRTVRAHVYRSAPYVALICLASASLLTPLAGYSPFGSFRMSLVAVLYLLLGVPMAFILGGSSSPSPWGVVGSQREAELMLAYEPPLVIGAFSVALMADSLSIERIIQLQSERYPFLVLNPFAAIAFLLAVIGKLHLKPFDIPEAEVEIVAGPMTEYSGGLLGVVEISKMLLTSVNVSLFLNLFVGGGTIPGLEAFTVPIFVLEGFLVVLLITLIHTLNPRLRIDQALEWYVKIPSLLAIVGLAWAYSVKEIFPTIM